MKQITIFARMGLKPENLEQVKALAAEGCRVAAEEPGTVSYDWHYSPEQGVSCCWNPTPTPMLTLPTCRRMVMVSSWAV